MKAVGWILREISKYDKPFSLQLIAGNLKHFSIESLRNALKYADKKERSQYLTNLKKSTKN